MSFSFGYNYFVEVPNQTSLLKGLFIPWCSNCGSDELMQAVSAVGAVIMPHNFYLHSALVKTRRINRRSKTAIKEANKYYFVEGAIALFISFIINLFVVAVFANGLYGTTYGQAYNNCLSRDSVFSDVFNEPDQSVLTVLVTS